MFKKSGIFVILMGLAIFGIYWSQSETPLLSGHGPQGTADHLYNVLEKNWKRLPKGDEKEAASWKYGVNQCLADDLVAMNIERDLLQSLAQQMKASPQNITAAILNSPFSLTASEKRDMDDQLQVQKLIAGKTSDTSSFGDYLKSFERIEDVRMEVVDFRIRGEDRETPSNEPSQMKLISEMDIRGYQKGHRIHDVLRVLVSTKRKGIQWEIENVSMSDGTRVTAQRTPAFADATAAVGLNQVPIHLRREAIRRGGYSVAVNDYNGDNVQDLFLGTGGKSQLFKGVKTAGSHKFEKAESQLEESSFVKSSVFADFDNDGDEDAVVIRFVDIKADRKQLVYYENKDGQFKESESAFGDVQWNRNYAMPAAAADFNNDSFLDFYVGFPGREDFTTLSNSKGGNRQPHGMFYSNRGKQFSHVENFEDLNEMMDSGNVFPHSAVAVDYDQDRDTDLVIIDDRNNLSPVLKNNGDTFLQESQLIGMGNRGYGMSIAAGDFNSDGLIDFAMTNVVSRSDVRLRESCARNHTKYVLPDMEEGLRLFQNLGNGRFADVTQASGVGWPGSATGGVVFFDYNNDGLDDLYVVNGLWSGNDSKYQLDTAWTHLQVIGYHDTYLRYKGEKPHSDLMDVLINYEGDLYKNQKMKGMNPSFAGFQKNKLYRNLGNGQFVDVAYHENLDRAEDGYAVVTLDLNQDGRQDLILRNADPGMDSHHFAPAQYFENNLKQAQNFLSLKLKGTTSNLDAIGTEVIVKTKNNSQVKQLLANNGPQQYERILHFGIGKETQAETTIHWPNGAESKLQLKAGFHHLVEPKMDKIVDKKAPQKTAQNF